MGFMDMLGGGKAMDASGAVNQILQAKRTIANMYGDSTAKMQPFVAGGTGAFQKLSGLLGVGEGMVKPKDQLFIEMARQYLPSTAKLYNATGTPGTETYMDNQTRMRYVVDPQTGVIQQKSMDAPGSQWKTIHDGSGLSAAVNAAYEAALTGAKGSEGYGSLLEDFTLDDYEESPNYQFNLEEGEKALNRQAAARGDYNSPATLQELLKYSQNLASNEYLNSYNMDAQNKGRTFDMLMGSSGIGMQGAGQQVGLNTNYGSQVAELNGQIGQLDLAQQADKAAKRQSAFGNLTSLASMAAAPFTGGTSLMGMAGSAGLSQGSKLLFNQGSLLSPIQWGR